MLKIKKMHEYPDLLNIEEMCAILRISKKTGYKLLHNDVIIPLRIGTKYRIPKCNVVDYINRKGGCNMVAGSLKEKNDYYYMVLELRDKNGKRKQKTIRTGLKVKGNKKRAEAMLLEHRSMYTNETPKTKVKSEPSDILFEVFMDAWLKTKKHSITRSTYGSYQMSVNAKIRPYFEGKYVTLSDLSPKDLQNFYEHLLKTISPSSVKRVYANINSALKFAIKQDYIATNVNEKTEIPRNNQYVADFYSAEETTNLFSASEGTAYEFPVLFGLFYGMRRSEAIGMKWSAINWENNTLTIAHTVTTATVDGKRELIFSDTTKTKSSRRTLPLMPFVRDKLLELKEKQEANKILCGNSYNRKYVDYICVNTVGDIINPDYITQTFKDFLIKNNLRPVRYHDLRHTAATNMHQLTGDFYTVGEILGHTLKGIGMSLGISTSLEAVTAQYVDVRLERKKSVLETYHKSLHPQKPDTAKGDTEQKGTAKKDKKKSSEMEL